MIAFFSAFLRHPSSSSAYFSSSFHFANVRFPLSSSSFFLPPRRRQLARALLLKPSAQPQETSAPRETPVELGQVTLGAVQRGLAEFDLAESGLGRVRLRFFWWGVLHWSVAVRAAVSQPPPQGRTRPAELGPDKLGRSNSAGQTRTRSNSAG